MNFSLHESPRCFSFVPLFMLFPSYGMAIASPSYLDMFKTKCIVRASQISAHKQFAIMSV